ncbi:ribonuclease R [Albibacterium bauzanense]|uniref:Ribonuclease R n=1 Tax=Albibacterium bauzanense TaxID=653929 RepID=A0A4R1LTV7_9SPHI|nr:ribonuclease R [Albibacterium bauzanense]TCK80699.1 ribonuclease R [Albibacterium bauzanense]
MAKNNTFKNILTQLITEVLQKSGNQALNYKQVSAKLNLPDQDSKMGIQEILKAGTRSGIFKEVAKGKYILKELRTVLTGRVDMTADGSAYIVTDDEFEDDIYIAPRKLRNALHGDIVKIHAYESKRIGKKEGEVVEIVERARKSFTGVLKVSPRFAFLIADDRKMLHDIFIPIEDLNGAKDGEKVVVTITDWPEGSKNPVGKVTDILGAQGENNTEMNAILADYGFPLSFPTAVEKEAEELSAQIPAEEIAKRKDFRNKLTFTIDPFDAKDFDDAISFVQLENGNYEIGVHIADVTHYVNPDTALDHEAFERGTSVYLVDRVIPMLPERLSNNLCSLRPNEDKLCFSAVFELDEKANILSEWFGKTVIHSDKRLSYEDAQELIESKQGELSQELELLNKLAYIMRDKRFKSGAISFETAETKFHLDKNGKPLGVYVRERKDAHKLIEDYMLLANKKVAEFIGKNHKGKSKLTFVYRAHDVPKESSLLNFAQFAARFGYKINMTSSKETAHSLNHLMEEVEGTKEQNVLTQLAIRSMAKAIYTTKSTSHYGLGFDYYTHFTSPIRRYPDMMVHRLLEHYLDNGKSVSEEAYEKMSVHASQMEKRAADAERASVKYKQAEYLLDQIGTEYIGIISGVTEWGMYVEIEENKCEGMIRLRDMTDDFYALDEKNYAIIGQRKKKKYQLGDEVRVRVKNVDLTKRQIDFTLVS